MKILTIDQEKEMVSQYINRENSKLEICKLYHISTKTLEKIFKKYNTPFRTRGESCIKISEKEHPNIINLYKNGISSLKIGKIYNVQYGAIVRILKQNNVEIRPYTECGLINVPRDTITQIVNMYVNNRKNVQEIALSLRYSISVIIRILKNNNINRRSNGESHIKHFPNHDYFETIDTPEKAYFLGFLYADGNVFPKTNCVSIRLQIRDKYILQAFSKEIYKKDIVRTQKTKKLTHQDTASLYIKSEKMCKDLANIECVPRKSLTLKFPNEKQVPKSFLWHCIRGEFDGDGCVCISTGGKRGKGRLYIAIHIVGSKDFISGLRNFLILEGIRCHKLLKMGKIYCVRIKHKKSVFLFYKKLYENATHFLFRKKNKFEEFFQNNPIQ